MTDQPLPGAYWRLWFAAAISNLGDGVFVIALSLLATRITDSPLSIGLIATFATIPWMLFALPVGVIIDRVDRRKVLVIADLSRGVLVGGLAVVAAFWDVQIWMLWLLAFGLGVGEVFFDNGAQTILPAIVPRDQLERANGYFSAAEVTTNTFLGMPLGGALFAFAVWLPFGVDAASFVVAALLAASLRGSFRPTNSVPSTGMIDDMRGGLRWLLGHRLLRTLALVVTVMNLAFATTQATFVLFAQQELHISDNAFGPLLAVIGAGSLLGGIIGGKVVGLFGRRASMLTAALTPVFTSTAIALWPVTWFVIAMITVQAFATTVGSILSVSLRQQIVPGQLFGRVNSIYRWFSTGAMPLGALLGGVLATAFGLRAPYFAAAALLLIASLLVATGLTNAALSAALTQYSPVTTEPTFATDVDTEDHDTDDTPVSIDRDPLDDLLAGP